MITGSLAARAQELRDSRVAFATATVVRVSHPTSARAGDRALVLPDGTVEGFVGGVCAADSVRLHGLRVMETGEPLLLRLVPDTAAAGEDHACCSGAAAEERVVDGAVTAHNACLSGGALDIFLEPVLPLPRLAVVGETPVATALAQLGALLEFEVVRAAPGAPFTIDDEVAAVIVASHGREEDPVLEAALREGVAFVGLVASTRRGEAVRAGLDVDEALRGRLRTPVGLDIGARAPAEIALSILAEIVRERRGGGASPDTAHGPVLVVTEGAPAGGGCCGGHGG